MSRVLQWDEPSEADADILRRELMHRSQTDLVAMLEDATAKEINARRLTERLLHRVALAEAAGKNIELRTQINLAKFEGDIWEQAARESQLGAEVLTRFLSKAVASLLPLSGRSRKARAQLLADLIGDSLGEDRHRPDPDCAEAGVEEALALGFYTLCQFAEVTPEGRTGAWYALGKALYESNS